MILECAARWGGGRVWGGGGERYTGTTTCGGVEMDGNSFLREFVEPEKQQEEEDMKPCLAWDIDRKRIYLVGPWGATWITTAKDVKKFEELYGKLDVRFGKATMDALDQKRTVPAL